MSKWITAGDTDYDTEPPRLVTPDDDWDVLTRSVMCTAADLHAAHLIFDKGLAHPDFEHMRVVDRDLREIACGTGRFKGEVIYKGIADTDRPVRYHIDAYGERSTYDAVVSPISVDPVAHDVSQPRLGVTVKYISIGRPDTDELGTNQTPPGGWTDVPDNPFSSATEYILAYPEGWVLEKRTGPNIPGAEIWLVEDQYVYYLEWRPAG